MNVKISISIGELVDKLTILEIKVEKIQDAQKNKHAQYEYQELTNSLKLFNTNQLSMINPHRAELKLVNLKLWELEDDIRLCEKNKKFDQNFISLARAVYQTNDLRFQLKNKINQQVGSLLVEVKSYLQY